MPSERVHRDTIWFKNNIDHHVDKSPLYYPDFHYKLRLLKFFIVVTNWASWVFFDPIRWLENFKYYTIWNETFVVMYFFAVLFFRPISAKNSEYLVGFQQATVTSQTLVVIVFWTVLFPNLGLGKQDYIVYINIYKHTVPFIFIMHEFFSTYGEYTRKGMYFCIGLFFAYDVLNVLLAFGFDIIVYPTKATDPKNWIAYPIIILNFVIVLGASQLFAKLKHRIVLKHFRDNYVPPNEILPADYV